MFGNRFLLAKRKGKCLAQQQDPTENRQAKLFQEKIGRSVDSSGSSIRRSSITKAGNSLARRVLIEGAWTYRMPARISRKIHDRLEPLSAPIRDLAWKAQVRLCARYRHLSAAGKAKVVVTTAIAREMVGLIWAIARIAQPIII